MSSTIDDMFRGVVTRLRRDFVAVNDHSEIRQKKHPDYDVQMDKIDGILTYSMWLKDGKFVRLFDIPGTLSGDLIQFKPAKLPEHTGDAYEIRGNKVVDIEHAQIPSGPSMPRDTESVEDVLALLPEIYLDYNRHSTKVLRYRSEVYNLLNCQRGSCLARPISKHIVRLFGKTSDGQLILEKLREIDFYATVPTNPIATYKRWTSQVISAFKGLHAMGIVHRHLRLKSIRFSQDWNRLIVCDLEGRWGNCYAPELGMEHTLDKPWSEKSDIFDIGVLIGSFIYGSTPGVKSIRWFVPPPFDIVVEACMRERPEDRATLQELSQMVAGIVTP